MLCAHNLGATLALFSAYEEKSPTYEVWWYELHLPSGARCSTVPRPNAEAVPFTWADTMISVAS